MSYPDRIVSAPTEIPGCHFWLDASDLATVTKDGAGKVSALADKSGNGRNVTQANGTKQPIYQATGGPNGTPAIAFDGADDQLAFAANFSYPAGCSIFAVLSATSTALRGTIFACKEWGVYHSFGVGGQWTFFSTADSPFAGRLADTGPHVISSVNTTAIVELRLDGAQTVKAPLTGAQARVNNSSIGQDPLGTAHPANMRLSEIIVYDRPVTAGERAQVEAYLSAKWGAGAKRAIAAPTELPGCTLWLDGADLATVTKNASNIVSQWADKSTSAAHFGQSDPTKRPTYTPNEIGGSGAIVFPGTGQTLFSATAPLAATNTVFLVWKHYGDSVPSTSDEVFSAISGSSYQLYLATTSTLALFGGSLSIFSAAPANRYLQSTVMVNTTDQSLMRGNGVALTRGARTFGGALTGLRLAGTGADPTETREAHCAFAEVIVFGRQLTDGEIAQVEAYLTKKYQVYPQRVITAPTEIPNCVTWLDAAQGVTADGAAKVSQWDDRSGLAHHAVQALAAKQPLRVLDAINGLPAIRFDGVDDFIRAAFTMSTPKTLFLVYKSITLGATTVHDVIADGGSALGMSVLSDSTPQMLTFDGVAVTAPGAVALGRYVVLAVKFDQFQSFFRVNGRTAAKGPGGLNAPGGLTLGAFGDGTRSSNIEVAEAVLYERALTDGQVHMVEQYLTAKFAVLP